MKLTQLDAYKALETKKASLEGIHLRELFATDPDRTAKLSRSYGKKQSKGCSRASGLTRAKTAKCFTWRCVKAMGPSLRRVT